jgi:tetratricopeptide (TPR) repeat protein|nr:tetratricopeptide repeat protein [Kofleriaceae bacterium]
MRSALVLLACSALGSGAVAFADARSEAQTHVDKASKLYDAKQYAAALDELNTAYTLDPQPTILYAIGQIHVSLGQCDEAITFYQRFLATNPDDGVASATREAIAACKTHSVPDASGSGSGSGSAGSGGSGSSASAGSGSAGAGTGSDTVGASVEPGPPSPPTWYSDRLADALVAGGVASAVIGLGLYVDARSQLTDADGATTYQGQQALVDKAHNNRAFALLFGAGGIALAVGGVLHYMHHKGEAAPAVSVTPIRGGAAVGWSVGF